MTHGVLLELFECSFIQFKQQVLVAASIGYNDTLSYDDAALWDVLSKSVRTLLIPFFFNLDFT
ncbi:uncharacterized protein EDB91DRAFT_1063423 [Suillus paluster]|uniref:uncharacterized protein n=1 Tax=Suillus paluster TaxID=48578 RepID=UPI001B85D76F|nr:uncharacterized protein EDB91DRAFT_1063423 [Suillus paluster]KAG1723415.1 hypothetical protein EDB91DRAFT_1063423 [Suillus paluster]